MDYEKKAEIVALSESSGKAAGKKATRHRMPNKKTAAIGLILIAIVVSGVIVVAANRETKPAVNIRGCSSSLNRQAATVLLPERLEQLDQIVDKIVKLPGYEQDPNCLYIVLTFHINASDAAGSQHYLSKLEKVYNPRVGYDQALEAAQAKTPAELQPTVDFLQQQGQQKFSPTGAPL
jgi:hypothetical protein